MVILTQQKLNALIDSTQRKAEEFYTSKLTEQRAQLQKMYSRSFAGAQVSRLTADWINLATSIDSDIRQGGKALRNRARDLEKNNSIAKRAIDLLVTNVVGPYGFTHVMNAGEHQFSVDTNGEYGFHFVADIIANAIIKKYYDEWTQQEHCSSDEKTSFLEMQQILYRYMVRDGEYLVRKITDKNSKFGYRLQILPPEILDENYNTTLSNGNVVIMGVELNQFRKPVAYHLCKYAPSPTSLFGYEIISSEHIRVDAAEIIHGYESYYANQTRGYSWLAPVMLNLKMLGAYEEAAIQNARSGATKLGWIEKDVNAVNAETSIGTAEDGNGNRIFEIAPLAINELNPGEKFTSFDTKYPDSEFAPFVKALYRSIAIGMGLDYMSLSGDLSEANYSSMRQGSLETRRNFRAKQEHFCTKFLKPNFAAWLEINLLKGTLETSGGKSLPYSAFEKFNRAEFYGVRWEWVDPLKDVSAAVMEISAGFSSPQEKVAEMGGSIEDVYRQIAEANLLAKKYGIVLESNKLALELFSAAQNNSTQDNKQQRAEGVGVADVMKLLAHKSNGHAKIEN